MSGAYRSAGNDDTAFGGSRTAAYVFNAEAAAFDQPTYEADRAWVRNFWEAMRPHAAGAGGYVNFLVEADDARVRASYGEEKYQRLARIKAQYDPENVFHFNANVKPRQREWRDRRSSRLLVGERNAAFADYLQAFMRRSRDRAKRADQTGDV